MRLVIIIFMFLMAGTISSCQFDPYAGDLTTEQPKEEDIIGAYKFEKQTISRVPIDKLGQEATIILKPDGTYQANNIPNVFIGTNAKTRKYISATGKWNIETVGGIDNGWGHIKSHWGITLTSIDKNLASIGLIGNKTPYKLIVTFDDPDLGKVMIFSNR